MACIACPSAAIYRRNQHLNNQLASLPSLRNVTPSKQAMYGSYSWFKQCHLPVKPTLKRPTGFSSLFEERYAIEVGKVWLVQLVSKCCHLPAKLAFKRPTRFSSLVKLLTTSTFILTKNCYKLGLCISYDYKSFGVFLRSK